MTFDIEVLIGLFKGDQLRFEVEEIAAFLKTILVMDPEKRPTAGDLLRHRWFKKGWREWLIGGGGEFGGIIVCGRKLGRIGVKARKEDGNTPLSIN